MAREGHHGICWRDVRCHRREGELDPNERPEHMMTIIMQLHLVVVVSNYYLHISHLSRDLPSRQPKDGALQRIYLLPNLALSTPRADSRVESTALVYAPIALSSLSEREVQGLNAREAWIRTNTSHPTRQHRHTHSRGHRHSNGRIVLPTHPDEGLLPVYEKYKD